jgi:hypothetical protein
LSAAGDPIPAIVVDTSDPAAMDLWRAVALIADALDGHDTRWCLVGGLMTALFAMEAGQTQRPTTDIDILADARQRPSGTRAVSERLRHLGGALTEVSGLDSERGFRFELQGQVVDVLAPDGLAVSPTTTGGMRTIQIPGGSQALDRIEPVDVLVENRRARLFRPTLLGAILLKARSLKVHDRPQDQREDLITLLNLMTDPRTAAASMKATERRWLRSIEPALDIEDPRLEALYDPAQLRIARASYRRLSA